MDKKYDKDGGFMSSLESLNSHKLANTATSVVYPGNRENESDNLR